MNHGYSLADEIFDDAQFVTEDVRQTDVDIREIRSVEIANVEIVSGDELPHLAVADLEVSADALITNWYIGGPDFDLLDESMDMAIRASTQVTVDLTANWIPESVDINGRAEVTLDEADGSGPVTSVRLASGLLRRPSTPDARALP